MTEEITVGDLVWQKGEDYSINAPQMTVEMIYDATVVMGVVGEKTATCSWADKSGMLQKETYPLSALTKKSPFDEIFSRKRTLPRG